MAVDPRFMEQVRLLVSVLPQVAKQQCFALKGGTAINLFVRDMPRLSVDIDLAYLPVQAREQSLAGMDAALRTIAQDIRRVLPGSKVREVVLAGESAYCVKLLVMRLGAMIKIETTPVLRGSVFPPVMGTVCARVQAEFGAVQMQLLGFEDLYAGKLCAALDRQHPRDLFDVHQLLADQGLTPALKDAFLVYLLSHNRPMAEMLQPTRKDVSLLYAAEFSGMTREPVDLNHLYTAREKLIATLHQLLTPEDRQFLMDVKRGEVQWERFVFPQAQHLPAVQWKLHNLDRMTSAKRQDALKKLERVLFATGKGLRAST